MQAVLLSALCAPLSLASIPAASGGEVSLVMLDVCHAGSPAFFLQADAPMLCEFFPDLQVPAGIGSVLPGAVWYFPAQIVVSIEHPPQV